MKSHQHDLDKFGDEAQTLQQMTGESRVATSVSQLTSRYQTIQHNVKVLITAFFISLSWLKVYTSTDIAMRMHVIWTGGIRNIPFFQHSGDYCRTLS